MKKLGIILLVLGIVAFGQMQGLADEEDYIGFVIERLRQIYAGQQRALNFDLDENGALFEFHPGPNGCPNNVCWQGQTLSSLNTADSSNQDLINVLGALSNKFCPQDLFVNLDDSNYGGDVRFRCRRQGEDGLNVWCFAYRCEHVSPAGCRQLWRLRFKPRSDGAATPLECFDVGNTGVCSGAPSTIAVWPSSCL